MSTRIVVGISVPVVKVGRHPKTSVRAVKVGRHPKTSALALNYFLQRTKGVRLNVPKLRAQICHEPDEANSAKSETIAQSKEEVKCEANTASTDAKGITISCFSKAKDFFMVYPVKNEVVGLLVHLLLNRSFWKFLAAINEVIPDFAEKIDPLNKIFGLPYLFWGLWKDYQDLLEKKKKIEEEKKKTEEEKERGEKQN